MRNSNYDITVAVLRKHIQRTGEKHRSLLLIITDSAGAASQLRNIISLQNMRGELRFAI